MPLDQIPTPVPKRNTASGKSKLASSGWLSIESEPTKTRSRLAGLHARRRVHEGTCTRHAGSSSRSTGICQHCTHASTARKRRAARSLADLWTVPNV